LRSFGIGSRLHQGDLPPRKRLPPCIRFHHLTDLSPLRPSAPSNTQRTVRESLPVSHRLRLSASPYGPTNPELIDMAQEPLGFRRRGFSPRLSRTHSGILTCLRSTGSLTAPLRCSDNAPLPHDPIRKWRHSLGFGDKLESRPLSAQIRLTGELLRTLSRNGCF
jgi:hypothetical protein